MSFLPKSVALGLIFLASAGCSNASPADELVLRVAAQGTCEGAGQSFDCAVAAEKLQPRCPKGGCAVRIEMDPGTTNEQLTAAFASVLKGKFGRISHHSESQEFSVR